MKMIGILIFLSFYMLFFKFVYLDSTIYLYLRNLHSKSYLKKNKPKNIFDRFFYIRYKTELDKHLFNINILYFVSGILGFFVIILNIITDLKYIDNYIVFLTVLAFFSNVIWITSSMFYKLQTYSIIQKILYISIYIYVITYWPIKIIIDILHQ